MKIQLVLIALTLVAFSCKRDYRNPELYGSYELNGLKISLRPDGKFHYESWYASCFGTETKELVDGDFFVKSQYVLLRPNQCHQQYFEFELINDKKLIWDSIRPINYVPNFYDSFLILPLNNKIFLLGANSSRLEKIRERNFTALTHISGGVKHFLNGINAGDTLGFHWRYLNKPCQSCNEPDLKKSLPDEWRHYLTRSEMKARVKQIDSIEVIFKVPYVTIDAGEKQGVRRGYEFFSESGDFFTILEVRPDFSKGVCFWKNPKSLFIGQSLSTVKPKKKSQ